MLALYPRALTSFLPLPPFLRKLTHPLDSIEQQAFGRVFRIGQHKETYVSRLVIKNTVDVRMFNMQADKVRTIDRAMQDVAEERSVEPLSVADLASLFGCLRDDGGVMQVDEDYVEQDDDDDAEDEGMVDDG